jgi:hypothetical protein
MIGSNVKRTGSLCRLVKVLMTVVHSFAVIFEERHRFFTEKEYFCRVF